MLNYRNREKMEWTRGHTIGQGSTATVSIATNSRSGEIFAVKSAELSQSEFLQREQKFMSSISRDPHIVSYKGSEITRENNKLMYNLKMEYAPGGTLVDAIGRRNGGLEESMMGRYTLQIVKGLEHLHSCGIVHCDIKGRNILICDNAAKIADLGCAKWVNDRVAIGGTPMFMAPEVARGEEQGFPADIWALGCTIIEMATGGSPWPYVNHHPMSILYEIAYSGKLPEVPDFLSQQVKDFLSKCLRLDPKERWTAKQLVDHPFLGALSCGGHHIQEFDTTSPTSILDQHIWNESQTLGFVETSDRDLRLGKKMRQLWVNSRVPSWTWEETWITIRESRDDVVDGESKGAFGLVTDIIGERS